MSVIRRNIDGKETGNPGRRILLFDRKSSKKYVAL